MNGVDILDPSATLPTGVSFNTETGVLTLENVAIDTAEPYYDIIYADSALTIELKGKNSLVGEGAERGILPGLRRPDPLGRRLPLRLREAIAALPPMPASRWRTPSRR